MRKEKKMDRWFLMQVWGVYRGISVPNGNSKRTYADFTLFILL